MITVHFGRIKKEKGKQEMHWTLHLQYRNTQTCSTALNISMMAQFGCVECITVLKMIVFKLSFAFQWSRIQVLFRNSYCAQCAWPWWTPSSPAALPSVCPSQELPHGWLSPRCRNPSQPDWLSETERRRAFHSDVPRSLREPCSFLRGEKGSSYIAGWSLLYTPFI